jgi:VIT1/CCC1 family predicted Fe2+/Mn2+ transporter
MRNFFIMLLLSISHLAGATVPAPANHCETTNIQFAFTGEQKIGKQRPAKRLIHKMLQKRMMKRLASSQGSDGKWLSILGLAIGLLGLLPYLISLEAGLFLAFPLALLGVIGFVLSLFGLLKARRWDGTRTIKGLAIAGIVVNALLLVGLLVFIGIALGE